MILTLLLIGLLAAGLVPLVQRDLRRAVEVRQFQKWLDDQLLVARFMTASLDFAKAMESVGLAAATAADRLREFLDTFEQESRR